MDQTIVGGAAGNLGQIQTAGNDVCDEIDGIADFGLDLNPGIPLHEHGQQLHQQVVAAQADAQVAAAQFGGRDEGVLEIVDQSQNLSGFKHQFLAKGAEFDMPAATPE
jgi:hypothetical protein